MTKVNNLSCFSIFFLMFSLLLPLSSSAAEEEVAAEETEKVKKEPLLYFPVTPNTLTFYQGTGKKIGYIVVQVQIVVRGQSNFDLLDANLPLIQDALTDFFNRQDKNTIEDLSLREGLRLSAKEKLAEVITEEIGKDIVENVLFTQYIFQ
jgi:flagellar protein FliL